jgi:hypothetical protein
MERRKTVDGDRDLLTGEAGGVRLRSAGGDDRAHAHARTDVGVAEVSLPSPTRAFAVLHLTAGFTLRSHETPCHTQPRPKKVRGFFCP